MAVHKGVGHYGAPITLDQAKKAMAAAEAKAKENNWNVVISIVDSGGHAVMLERLDGTQLASIRIADGKARTAVEFRRPTKALEDVIADGGAGLRYFTMAGVNQMEGGVPIVIDGKIVGGIGVSGVDLRMTPRSRRPGPTPFYEYTPFTTLGDSLTPLLVVNPFSAMRPPVGRAMSSRMAWRTAGKVGWAVAPQGGDAGGRHMRSSS